LIEIDVLGVPRASVDGCDVRLAGAPKQTILTVLALNAGEAVSEDRLAEAVWGEAAVNRSRSTLHVHVHKLREALGDVDHRVIRRVGTGYLLDPLEAMVDAVVWLERVREAEALADRGDHQRAADRYGAALALWGGGPQIATDSTEVDSLGRHWEEHWRSIAEQWVESSLRAGRPEVVIADLRAWVEENPFHEPFWVQLVHALYLDGRQVEALRAYQEARSLLLEEAGLDPGQELEAMQAAILRQSASLRTSGVEPALIWLGTGGEAKRLVLHADHPTVIGRGADCDLVLSFDSMVSRRHAQVTCDHTGTWAIEDLDSRNGTWIDGQRISNPIELTDRMVVRCGITPLVFSAPDDDVSGPGGGLPTGATGTTDFVV